MLTSKIKKDILTASLLGVSVIFAFGSAWALEQSGTRINENRLQDIQIGEKGRFTRIALICRINCDVVQEQSGFRLADINQNMNIDLKSHSGNAHNISVEKKGQYSFLRVASSKSIIRSSVKRCELGGKKATCIDLEFLPSPTIQTASIQESTQPTIANASKKPERRVEIKTPKSLPSKPAPQNPVSLTVPEAIGSPQKLTLRNQDNLQDEELAKSVTAQLRDVDLKQPATREVITPVSATPSLRPQGSVLRPAETQLLLGRVDFREQSETILRKTFDSETCTRARAILKDDAWALGAMGTIGFCLGAAGNFEEAETVFRRLNKQEPQNYEALLGRALIAAITGEKSIALKYFNDALETNPPDYVSDRINKTLAVY